MTDPRDLIRARGAPTPLARPVPTEVRSDGGLMINLLQAPYWAGPATTPIIAEWTWTMSLQALLALRNWLVTPDPNTGIQPEAAIDAGLKGYGIGSYIGTFVTAGPNYNQVRVLFGKAPKAMINAYCPEDGHDPASFNRLIYKLLHEHNSQAAAALRHLRQLWSDSPNRNDAQFIMLSQVDLEGELTNPARSPFAADQLTRVKEN